MRKLVEFWRQRVKRYHDIAKDQQKRGNRERATQYRAMAEIVGICAGELEDELKDGEYIPADPVRALNIVAAAAFEVIDRTVENGQVSSESIHADDWAGLRDELEAAGRDVENALKGRD